MGGLSKEERQFQQVVQANVLSFSFFGGWRGESFSTVSPRLPLRSHLVVLYYLSCKAGFRGGGRLDCRSAVHARIPAQSFPFCLICIRDTEETVKVCIRAQTENLYCSALMI